MLLMNIWMPPGQKDHPETARGAAFQGLGFDGLVGYSPIAVAKNAVIASLAASQITAGTIYTGLVKIAGDSGEKLLIDGFTLRAKDANSVVRVQYWQCKIN